MLLQALHWNTTGKFSSVFNLSTAVTSDSSSEFTAIFFRQTRSAVGTSCKTIIKLIVATFYWFLHDINLKMRLRQSLKKHVESIVIFTSHSRKEKQKKKESKRHEWNLERCSVTSFESCVQPRSFAHKGSRGKAQGMGDRNRFLQPSHGKVAT